MQSNANLEFRKIPSLNFLYEVNENGAIFRNVKSKKQCQIRLDETANRYVASVRLGGRGPHARIVHIPICNAVAECWLGPRSAGYKTEHRDDNEHNNDYRNLRYVAEGERTAEQKKPVSLCRDGEIVAFESYAACARWLSKKIPNVSYETIRQKLKAKRKCVFGYTLKYLSECRDCTR